MTEVDVRKGYFVKPIKCCITCKDSIDVYVAGGSVTRCSNWKPRGLAEISGEVSRLGYCSLWNGPKEDSQ
jgi:hypothetical protein